MNELQFLKLQAALLGARVTVLDPMDLGREKNWVLFDVQHAFGAIGETELECYKKLVERLWTNS